MAASAGPVLVAEARARAARRVERDQRGWAAIGDDGATLDIALHPPTERDALADQAAAIAWVEAWRDVHDAAFDGITITWAERAWASLGRQRVPVRCAVVGADAIAAFAGPRVAREWRRLRDRASLIVERFAPSPPLSLALRAHGGTLQRLDETDFDILIGVLEWLVQHPASGYRVRQLPIEGVHSKWLGAHRSLIESLHAAITGRGSLGLLPPPGLMRMRVLDPTLRPGGLCDITAPIEELARLPLRPRIVYVFENLESVVAMPEIVGAVVVHGSGYAVGRLREIPWLRTAAVVYWGDLDADGFAILNALRSHVDGVVSVLMDEATLLAYRRLWVADPGSAAGISATRELPHLTASERAALTRIAAEGGVRLEQERIPWPAALVALLATVPA